MVTITWLPVYSETTPEDHLFDQDLYVTDLQTYSMCCGALYKDRLSFWLVTTLFEQVFVGPHVSPFSSLPLNEMQCRTTKLSRGQEGVRGGETTTKLWISSLASPFTALLHPLTECSTWGKVPLTGGEKRGSCQALNLYVSSFPAPVHPLTECSAGEQCAIYWRMGAREGKLPNSGSSRH